MLEVFIENWISVLCTVVVGILSVIVRQLFKKFREEKTKQDALAKGVQALLRSQMINDYYHYRDKGYAPIYAKENFENCWQQYHSLGVNGVMDNIHNEFMEFKTTKN